MQDRKLIDIEVLEMPVHKKLEFNIIIELVLGDFRKSIAKFLFGLAFQVLKVRVEHLKDYSAEINIYDISARSL